MPNQDLGRDKGFASWPRKKVPELAIKRTPDLRWSLMEELEDNETAVFFSFEEDKMYSMRESELIQQDL